MITEAPNWKPPVTSGCTKQLRQLSLSELLNWADKEDIMIAELVRRIVELRGTNARIQAERTNAYRALEEAENTIKDLRKHLAGFYGTEERY